MPKVYDFVQGILTVSANTRDTVAMRLAYNMPAALIAVHLWAPGAIGADLDAVRYYVSLRSADDTTGTAPPETNRYTPIMQGWLRRHGEDAGSSGTNVTVDEGGVRWQGYEPLQKSYGTAGAASFGPMRLELYAASLNGAAATLHIRGVVEVDVP